MSLDTVVIASKTPEQSQPWRELGLKEDEYQRIREILGRRPSSSELAMYSVMWSEHCSYKSSKVHLRQFGEKAPATDVLLVGIGENAGVVDIGQGYAILDTGFAFRAAFRKPDWWLPGQDLRMEAAALREVVPAYTRKAATFYGGFDRTFSPHWQARIGLAAAGADAQVHD